MRKKYILQSTYEESWLESSSAEHDHIIKESREINRNKTQKTRNGSFQQETKMEDTKSKLWEALFEDALEQVLCLASKFNHLTRTSQNNLGVKNNIQWK